MIQAISVLQFNCAERGVKVIESWLAISIIQLSPLKIIANCLFFFVCIKKQVIKREAQLPSLFSAPCGGVSRQQQHKHLQEYFEDILKFHMPQHL